MNREQKVIILISALKSIMAIFLGPFLTVYFLKASTESIYSLSIYYILSYFVLGFGSLIVAIIVNNRYRIEMYRFGVICNFIYMMAIVLLQEKIVRYLPIIAILYGIGLCTYWYPFNMFMINKVQNQERVHFLAVNNIVSSLVGVITPILLGAILTVSDFKLTSLIIAIISGIIIFLSFFIKTEKYYDLPPVTYKETWKYLMDHKTTRRALFSDYVRGITISDGAINILTTILIYQSFKTNLNLGIINSFATVLKIFYIQYYQSHYKDKSDKNILFISSIFPAIALLFLFAWKSNITLVFYHICFTVFTGLLAMGYDIKMHNISHGNLIDEDKQIEFLAFRECILNLGRITSYLLVSVVFLLPIQIPIDLLIVFFTIGTIYTGYLSSKLNRHEQKKIKRKKYLSREEKSLA